MDPTEVNRQVVTGESVDPKLALQVAYSVSFVLPAVLLGRPIKVFFDLFDRPHGLAVLFGGFEFRLHFCSIRLRMNLCRSSSPPGRSTTTVAMNGAPNLLGFREEWFVVSGVIACSLRLRTNSTK